MPKEPAIKIEFHYKSGKSLTVDLYDNTNLNKIPSGLRKQYEQFLEKAKGLEQEAWRLGEEGVKYLSAEDIIKGIKVRLVTRHEL